MQLSYTTRLICLALCGTGLLQLLLQCLAWLAGPRFLQHAVTADPRRVERSLFLLALLGRLSAPLLVLGAWLPAYVRGEDNAASESVGPLCLAGAACVLVWCLLSWFRAIQAWIGAQRYSARCRRVGDSFDGLPMLLSPCNRPLLAVVGVFRPRILVSQPLLESGRFSAEALELAFQHEHAHARRRDNLKLLVLSLLPCIPFATAARPSLDHLWRLAAEMAADEEGLRGHPESSVLLAEMLVKMARESMAQAPRASFGLLSRADDLRVRVDRLLLRQTMGLTAPTAAAVNLSILGAIAAGAVTLLVVCCLCIFLGHRGAELLLHAGLHLRTTVL